MLTVMGTLYWKRYKWHGSSTIMPNDETTDKKRDLCHRHRLAFYEFFILEDSHPHILSVSPFIREVGAVIALESEGSPITHWRFRTLPPRPSKN